MPIYECKCSKCGEVYEAMVINTMDKPICTKCGSRDHERLVSNTSFRKGAGHWDTNGYHYKPSAAEKAPK